MDIILEALLYFTLTFPGAFVRWIFTGRKKPFKEILADEVYWNVTIGLLMLLPIIILIVILSNQVV